MSFRGYRCGWRGNGPQVTVRPRALASKNLGHSAPKRTTYGLPRSPPRAATPDRALVPVLFAALFRMFLELMTDSKGLSPIERYTGQAVYTGRLPYAKLDSGNVAHGDDGRRQLSHFSKCSVGNRWCDFPSGNALHIKLNFLGGSQV